MSHIIAPSILAADFAKLGEEVEMINRSRAEWIHIDVMDGMFVPNISFGLPVLEAIRRHTKKYCDVHLMIEKPERYLSAFKKAGADGISIHIEACTHLHSALQQIKSLGCKAGIVLNPHTAVSSLSNIINDADLVLIMSVNPGFGGQQFIASSLDKVRELKKMIQDKNANCLIEMDGGVTPDNIAEVISAGVDIAVSGSAVFKSPDPIATINGMLF